MLMLGRKAVDGFHTERGQELKDPRQEEQVPKFLEEPGGEVGGNGGTERCCSGGHSQEGWTEQPCRGVKVRACPLMNVMVM